MKITEKRVIVVLRERTLTIKFGNRSGERFCEVCGTRTQFITVDEGAVLQIKPLGVFRLVEAEKIHFNETETGSLPVCFKSPAEIDDETKLLTK